jgi:hypothetical protein
MRSSGRVGRERLVEWQLVLSAMMVGTSLASIVVAVESALVPR